MLIASSASLIWRDDASLLPLVTALDGGVLDLLVNVYGNGRYAQFAACLDNATGDFAAIRNQDLLDNGSPIVSQW